MTKQLFPSVFVTVLPGWPFPHQPAPDAHELLPVCHGHHYVLLRSHQGAAWQGAADQPRLLPWEGTADTSSVLSSEPLVQPALPLAALTAFLLLQVALSEG